MKRRGKQTPQHPILPGVFSPPASPAAPRSRRLSTPREQALEVARPRLLAAVFVFALAWLTISGRLAYLTLGNATPEAQAAHNEASESVAARADITDRNGEVLATSLPTTSLCADAKKITDPEGAARQLITALPDLDAAKLAEDLHSGKQCAMIKRHLTPKQSYEVNKLGIAGLEFRPDERRLYPAGNVTAHVVGYTDIDNNGLAGVEKTFDTKLQEQATPVALSIDLRVQNILRRELANAQDTFHAIGAAGLVMDITTGEILAMASLPDFDPQHPGSASDDAKFNRDTLGVYEMGSTFKIFNTALALDSGLIRPGDQFDTTHPVQVGSQFIKDFEPEKRWLNVAEIFTHSSNIGAARMAERFGGARQRAFLARLGLTEKVALEVPEVGSPLVPSTANWGVPTTMTVAFGHGIAVNSIQLAAAVATIINNGVPVHPTLIKQTTPVVQNEVPVISSHTSAIMRAMLRLVVTHGTAKQADVAGYMLGGKTGTAEKLGGGKYKKDARLSSFISAFPLNHPKYIVFAMIDEPKGNAKTFGFATGGWVAAPAVSHVASQIAPLLGLAPLTPAADAAAEAHLLHPLGTLVLDGAPVEEGSTYASVDTDSIH